MNALHVVPKAEQDRQAEPHEIKRALQHLIGSFPNSSKKEDRGARRPHGGLRRLRHDTRCL
ncbi:MAG: hypothetical protein QOK44_178 [Betaproteobacteria bacterium]|jgi:hypothetical protein|nr:hypothetical protein [Betaproteobacteria bacterium]